MIKSKRKLECIITVSEQEIGTNTQSSTRVNKDSSKKTKKQFTSSDMDMKEQTSTTSNKSVNLITQSQPALDTCIKPLIITVKHQSLTDPTVIAIQISTDRLISESHSQINTMTPKQQEHPSVTTSSQSITAAKLNHSTVKPQSSVPSFTIPKSTKRIGTVEHTSDIDFIPNVAVSERVCHLPLTGSYGIGKYALVSEIDLDNTQSLCKWSIVGMYAQGTLNGEAITLHSYIYERMTGMKVPEGKKVDHADLNKMNYTRENMRLVDIYQNRANTANSSNNTSGCKHVGWDKDRGRWMVRVHTSKPGGYNFTARYDTIEAAVEAAKLAAKKQNPEHFRCDTNDDYIAISHDFDIIRASQPSLQFERYHEEQKLIREILPEHNEPSVNFVQIQKHWEELESSGESIKFVQIFMTGHWAQNGEYFIADAKYKDVLNQRSWQYKNRMSPVTSFGEKSIFAHWFILRVLEQRKKPDRYHDTIDHDNIKPLDDSTSNLRYSTKAKQQSNRAIPVNNTSGAKGVIKINSEFGGWKCKLSYENNSITLGSFRIFEVAVFFYDIAVEQWVGEAGKPNYVLRGDKYAWKFGDECIQITSLLELQTYVSKPKNVIRFKRITGLEARIITEIQQLRLFESRRNAGTMGITCQELPQYNKSSTNSSTSVSSVQLSKPTASMNKEEIDDLIRQAIEQDELDDAADAEQSEDETVQ